ncbi:MAG TPA: diguanylate cyclase, partial [Pirellulales bacterium]|nr:diguanylate cyclase [Pirellulales bacterium]
RLAERFADLMVDSRHSALEELISEPARQTSLTIAQVEELVEIIEEKVDQLANVFSCELPQGMDYRDLLLEAHRRMSKLASEVAGDLMRHERAAATSPADAEMQADMEELTAAAAEFARVGRTKEPVESLAQSHSAAPATASAVATATTAAPAATAVACPAQPVPGPGGLSVELRLEVAKALINCRQARQALSLVLVEIDHFATLARTLGLVAAETRVVKLGEVCRGCDLPTATLLHVREACFAIILPDCDRGEAVAIADDILHQVRQHPDSHGGIKGLEFLVSVGAATVPLPPKNFRVDDLIDSANRCLSTAQLSGGNTLKSIGVY